jgi:hypothetical protein
MAKKRALDTKVRILSDSALDSAVSSRIPAVPKLIAVLALMVILLSGLGCSRKATPALALHQQSAIQVQVGEDGIRIQTPSAQFVLLPSGYLKAALLPEGKSLSLDDANVKPGQRVSVGGKEVLDLTFDLSQAKISAAGGKLGPMGTHIDVAGQSPSTGLTEKLTIEVYDDFPTVALISASFQNTGSHDLTIDAISIVAGLQSPWRMSSPDNPFPRWCVRSGEMCELAAVAAEALRFQWTKKTIRYKKKSSSFSDRAYWPTCIVPQETIC